MRYKNHSQRVFKQPLLLTSFVCLCLVGMTPMAETQQAKQAAPRGQLNSSSLLGPTAILGDGCGKKSLLRQSFSGVKAVHVESGAEPGANDPMAVPAGRYQLFPDNGIASFEPYMGKVGALYYTTDKDASMKLDDQKVLEDYPWSPNTSGPTSFFATAGRILRPDHDDLVTAKRVGQPSDLSTVTIDFVGQGHSVVLPETILPRATVSSDFLDITSADLDNIPGKDGNLHDEVIVGRVTWGDPDQKTGPKYYRYQIDVLDYRSGDIDSPEITSEHYAEFRPTFNLNGNGNAGVLPNDNILALAVGDFDGDGQKEIALVSLGDETILLHTFRYEAIGGLHRLTPVDAKYWVVNDANFPSNVRSLGMVGTISAATGNFDGGGHDEIAVAYARRGSNSYGNGVLVLKYDSQLHASLTSANFSQVPDNAVPPGYPRYTRPRVQLVAGQFLLQPPTIAFGRRQLALAWNKGQDNVNVRTLKVSNQGSNGMETVDTFGSPLQEAAQGGRQFSIAAGGFQGAAGPTPTSSLALSSFKGNGTDLNVFRLETLAVTDADGPRLASVQEMPEQGAYEGRFPLVAYDLPGNSRYLGTPARITLMNKVQTSFIMEEPPKHAYWDETKNVVVNVNRLDKNNVTMSTENSVSMKTSSKDESAQSMGGSTAGSAGGSLNSSVNVGIAKVDTKATLDLSVKAGYDYEQNEEHYNSNYSETTIESSGQTNRDDFLKGRLQTIDVWRYRVYGAPNDEDPNKNVFYELIFPGRSVDFQGGGLNFSWYQPIHENGNILSYPSRFGSGDYPGLPVDIGDLTIARSTDVRKLAQTRPIRLSFDGTAGSIGLQYSSEFASGSEYEYSNEIAESADVKTSYSADVQFAKVGGGEAHGCASMEVHNSNSWGGAKTSENEAKDETQIVFNKLSGNPSDSYPFYPMIYNTQDGTMKMSFALPNPADPANFSGFHTYAGLYGEKPDPALNLPLRFYPVVRGNGNLQEWQPAQGIQRKQMRGIFFRSAEKDPVSQTYVMSEFNQTAGQIIRIEPRIYNYSTAQAATGIQVQFQLIPYDDSVDSEICQSPISGSPGSKAKLICPRSERTTLGTITIPRLEPLQFTCVAGFDDPSITGCADPAYFNWDTTKFGPLRGATAYRVYIVLNPDEPAGQETYNIEPPSIQITDVSNNDNMIVTTQWHPFETGEYVTIGGVRGLETANATYQVTRISGTKFSLNGSRPGNGMYGGGGTATLLDPGQNNEGYSTIAIAAPQNPNVTALQDPNDYLKDDSLEAFRQQGKTLLLASDQITATQYTPVPLRFTAHSTVVHHDSAHMLLYDGDPATGVPAIADQIIHPGANGPTGTSVWFNWFPETTGVHHLHAVLLEGPNSTQDAAELTVNVAPAN